MNSINLQILKLTISLVLLGLLSGCVTRGGKFVDPPTFLAYELERALFEADNKPREPDSHRTGKNYYEPEILTSNEDMIGIKYLSVGPNAEHEQVKQLMFDHCHGDYIETSRVELRGYTTVEAECTHATESLQ